VTHSVPGKRHGWFADRIVLLFSSRFRARLVKQIARMNNARIEKRFCIESHVVIEDVTYVEDQ
jgi:hypothetical protein